MDFYKFRTKDNQKAGTTELYPDFVVGRSTDLMVRGGKFYAVWDEKAGLWSRDEYDVARLVDEELYAEAKDPKHAGRVMIVKDMKSHDTGSWSRFQKWLREVSDNNVVLDQTLTFANTEVTKSDYRSKRLPYALEPGDCSAWDELVGTLYSVENREKIEWFIGAIVSGDSRNIQKFAVFYGPPGSGKGTVLDICHKLFDGYTTTFEANQLGNSSSQFALEVFKDYPLVGIQGDGNMSRIQDNARINSIVSHEPMTVNEKFKSAVTDTIHTMLLMGTNSPVQITDAKSGLIRRLVDIHPTGVSIPIAHYFHLIARTDFELGAIAHHCLGVYKKLGKNHYSTYRPLEMMLQTDPFFNFIEYYFDVFKAQDGATLTQGFTMYKAYCDDANIDKPMNRQKFQFEFRNYFDDFKDRGGVDADGNQVRNYYSGFNAHKFKQPSKDDTGFVLVLDQEDSLLDDVLAYMPAQYARELPDGGYIPEKYWDDSEREIRGKKQRPRPDQVCNTNLSQLDTSDLHYVLVPANHIVIDFDLKDEFGNKSLELNLQAASNWPPTYAEISQGGNGVHLHYEYEGDVTELSTVYSEGIEIKTLLGKSSLRRRLSKCNTSPIAPMKAGALPVKEKKMLDKKVMSSEKTVRRMIAENLEKQHVPGTKPSVDFIKKILDDAYYGGMSYDVTDMRGQIMAFAAGSSNQKLEALKIVTQMKWKSEDIGAEGTDPAFGDTPYERADEVAADDRLVFYDVEVFPNLFVICWMYEDSDVVNVMVNPTSQAVEQLLKLKLVGFYNRRYDNHIIYAAYMGYTVERLYKLSQKMIEEKDSNATFGEAYNLSHADIWDFASIKQSLKKWEIALDILHMELDIPWNQPVPEHLWDKVIEYCKNDVRATQAVFQDRKQDYIARQILADISGLSVNSTTQTHTARIIFGNDRKPQDSFEYTELDKAGFPDYTFDPTRTPKSLYRGEDPSEGGYVYAEPGMYENVEVWDVASMHPTSIVELNAFGRYTPRFKELLDARIAIKRKDYDRARKMLDGKLEPYLQDPKDAKQLSYALKIVINIVYGLTSAKFDNPFRDIRNRDNIVAKRGALFMIDLKHFVQERGFKVVHIKTDSIKVVDPTDKLRQEVFEFGLKYGYEFEHEATYDRFALVNDAVYIARYGWHADGDDLIGQWDATGAQFQHPYVFKTLFSGEEIVFRDFCEAKSVQKSAMYLDFEHTRPDPTPERMKFVGRTGLFTPVAEGEGGGMLYRYQDEKLYKVAGTTGHLWMESQVAQELEKTVDKTYYDKLVDKAYKDLAAFGDVDRFIS